MDEEKTPTSWSKARGSGTLTVTELAEYLKISRSMIYRLLKRGELPGFKMGSDWLFNAEEIDRWLEERKIGPRRP